VRHAADNTTPSAHAVFRTFDGLEVELTGHKDGTRDFIAVVARSGSKDTQAEADTLNTRTKGWEFEVPTYKYDGMFRPLEDLLKKPPEPPAKNGKGQAKGGKAKPDATPAPDQSSTSSSQQ